MEKLFSFFHPIIWSPVLLLFLFLLGIFFAFFFLKEKKDPKLLFSKNLTLPEGQMRPILSLMTSLASAIGTGSVVGVITAIEIGGLGALFWMWIASFSVFSIKYAESLFAFYFQKNRKNGNPKKHLGPMLYMVEGLNWKKTAKIFAFLGLLGSLVGTGNWVQMQSISESAFFLTSLPPLWTGIIFSLLTFWIILGGANAIGKISAIFVPIMSALYIFGGLISLFHHSDLLFIIFKKIFYEAFHGKAGVGGLTGAGVMTAIQMGFARSILCNETGLGLSSVVASSCQTENPKKQALLIAIGTIFGPLFICTITSFLVGIAFHQSASFSRGIFLIADIFSKNLWYGDSIVFIGVILLAYSTVIAWAYFGEVCAEFLFEKKAIPYFRYLFCLFLIPGSLMTSKSVWMVADITNGLMIIPNLLAISFLSFRFYLLKKEKTKINL